MNTATTAAPPTPGAEPLAGAIAAGHAFYGPSAIVPAEGRRLAKAQTQLETALGAYTETGEGGVTHLSSGLTFAELTMGGQPWLVSPGRSHGPRIEPGQPVRAVTGVCLFGAGSVLATTTGGDWDVMGAAPHIAAKPPGIITAIDVDPRPHLQEWMTTTSLGGFLAAFARHPEAGPLTVFIHMPDVEYHLFWLWLRQHNLITTAALADATRVTQERRAALTEAFTAQLGDCATVVCASPLTWARWADDAAMTGDWADAMTSSGDPLWQALAARRDGNRLRDLHHLSYQYGYLSTAALARDNGAALLLAENPDEMPIYALSMDAAADAGVPLDEAVGCYIHPPMVPVEAGPYPYDLPLLVSN